MTWPVHVTRWVSALAEPLTGIRPKPPAAAAMPMKRLRARRRDIAGALVGVTVLGGWCGVALVLPACAVSAVHGTRRLGRGAEDIVLRHLCESHDAPSMFGREFFRDALVRERHGLLGAHATLHP